MEQCPCGSEKAVAECCAVYLADKALAPTAEALMRSRYSAYVFGDIDYLIRTLPMLDRKSFDRLSAKEWSRSSEWLGLEIVATEAGQETDSIGTVEFKARFKHDGIEYTHHEIGSFKRAGKRWLFVDGKVVSESSDTPLPENSEENPQVATPTRNALCPCGSRKKFKRCCGQKT